MKKTIVGAMIWVSFISPVSYSHADDKLYTNSIGISMVDIPAGSFVMGSCKLIELTSGQRTANEKMFFLVCPPSIPPLI